MKKTEIIGEQKLNLNYYSSNNNSSNTSLGEQDNDDSESDNQLSLGINNDNLSEKNTSADDDDDDKPIDCKVNFVNFVPKKQAFVASCDSRATCSVDDETCNSKSADAAALVATRNKDSCRSKRRELTIGVGSTKQKTLTACQDESNVDEPARYNQATLRACDRHASDSNSSNKLMQPYQQASNINIVCNQNLNNYSKLNQHDSLINQNTNVLYKTTTTTNSHSDNNNNDNNNSNSIRYRSTKNLVDEIISKYSNNEPTSHQESRQISSVALKSSISAQHSNIQQQGTNIRTESQGKNPANCRYSQFDAMQVDHSSSQFAQSGQQLPETSYHQQNQNQHQQIRRKQSNSSNKDEVRFIRSLTARRSFFRAISIEPVVFLAIFALYIEFPTIQDLVYTKICLEKVALSNDISQIVFNSSNLSTTKKPLLVNLEIDNVTINNSSFKINEGLNSTQLTSQQNNATTTTPSSLSIAQPLIAQNNTSIISETQNSTSAITNTELPTDALEPAGKIQNLSQPIVVDIKAHLTVAPNEQNNSTTQTTTTTTTTTTTPNTSSNDDLLLENMIELCTRKLSRGIKNRELNNDVADSFSLFWLRYQLIICFTCILTVPYWGGLSDKIGRLIPICAPIVIAMLTNILSVAYSVLIRLGMQQALRIEWMYVGAVLIGISGGQAVLISNSFNFITDHSTTENRSARVTILEAVIFIAHSFGFYSSKLILSMSIASKQQFWLNRLFVGFNSCILIHFCALLYALVFLRRFKFHKFLNNFQREQQEILNISSLSTSTSFTQIYDADAAASAKARNSPIMRTYLDENERKTKSGLATNELHCNDRVSPISAPISLTDVSRPNLSVSQQLNGVNPTSTTNLVASNIIDENDNSSSSFWTFATLNYYKETYQTIVKNRPTKSLIVIIILCGFASSLFLTIQISLLYSFFRRRPFNWDSSEYSSWNAIGSISRGSSLVILSICMRFVSFWRVPDSVVSAIGFISKGAGLLIIALAESTYLIYWSLVGLIFSEFSIPPLRSLLSKLIPRDEVGKAYACLAATQGICLSLLNLVLYLSYAPRAEAPKQVDSSMSFFRLSFITVSIFQFIAAAALLVAHKSISKHILAH